MHSWMQFLVVLDLELSITNTFCILELIQRTKSHEILLEAIITLWSSQQTYVSYPNH